MKKEQMFQELLKVYTDCPSMFEENGIKYLKWLDKIKTYNQTRMAWRYMFNKLYYCIRDLQKIWECHSKETWAGLKGINKTCDEMIKLRAELHDFTIIWRIRPVFKRGQI